MRWIGVDCHKWQQTAVMLDEQEELVATWQGGTRPEDWQALLDWAVANGNERCWGIEGSGHYGRGVAQFLVSQGEPVVEVNTRLTALGRRQRGSLHKTDHRDAAAIATVVRRQAVQLPTVEREDATALVALLTREREDLQAAAIRLRNQLHALVQHAEPGAPKARLQRPADLERWQQYQPSRPTPLEQLRAERIRSRAQRLAGLLEEIDAVEHDLAATGSQIAAPLQEIVGVGWLTAGMLAGYLGPGCRFASDGKLAAYAGVAPLEVSSAGRERHRLNRNGHRQLNAIVHRIALSQLRHSDEARAYVARRMRDGKSQREAVRALKRYIVRRIYRQWQQCVPHLPPSMEVATT